MCLLCLCTYCQENIAISGQVIDNQTKEGLSFVNITILKTADQSLVTGVITDDEGLFKIENISPDNYMLHFSYIGYTPVNKTIIAGGLNTIFDLGKVTLQAATENLQEVEVIGQQTTTNADLNKKTFNLSNTIAQSGGTVVDAMKTMPGVSFDQDGKVILRGSDKVVVLIDGKQSSLTGFGNQKGLSTIPASNIERIEIINNPSAKYDANGFAGIVNIIYKKEKQSGFNGDIGLSFGLGALTKRQSDVATALGSYSLNPKAIPSLNLNYKKGKFNYFLQSDFILQKALPNNEFTTRYYDNNETIASQVPENRKQFRTILNGGIDYNHDENNSFTLSALYDRERHIDTAQVAFINVNTNQRNRYYNWQEEEVTRNINITGNYQHKFKQKGHTLNLSALYTQGLEDETYSLNDSSSVRVGSDKTNIRAIENTTSVATDYVKPLANGRFEVGAKVRIRRLPVDYTITPGNASIIYPNLGTYSDWGENLYAAYTNYVVEKKHYDIEAGLRLEQTDVFYNLDEQNAYYPSNDKYNYLRLFPNVRFTLKLKNYQKLSFFYNRRIDRPGEPELRIFPKYDDPELLKVGNPYLRPQYTDAFEVAHKITWTSGSVFSALYHRIIQDQYMRIYSIDETNEDYNIVNRIYQNTGRATNSGIEILVSQDIHNSVKLSGSFNAFINRIQDYQGTLLFPYERSFFINKSNNTAWDAKISSEFKLPYAISTQLTGVYFSPKNIPQGKQLGRSSVDIGFKKAIWQNKGEVTLSASDIFNTFGIRQEIYGDGFSAIYHNYYETQVVRLGLKYRF